MTFSLRILRYKRRFHWPITFVCFILSSWLLQTVQSNKTTSQNIITTNAQDLQSNATTIANGGINETDSSKNSSTANEITTRNESEIQEEENKPNEGRYANYMLLHILICIYSFLGITVACHYYFVPSMSRICEDLKLSEDIVGATFMAAGSSAPELATVIIAVFFTEDDIGISDVIGSAVFNMLFVIALCGLFANAALQLNWWPMVRNCFFYTISIIIMLKAISNEKVSWFESLLLIISYILYCVALYYNEFLEAWANTLPLPFNKMQNLDIKETDANYIPLEDRKLSTYAPTTERNSIVQSNGKVISSIQQTYQSNVPEPGAPPAEEIKPVLAPNAGLVAQMKYYFVSPVYFICEWTIPDWQHDSFFKSYLLTFFVSLIWISIYSYIMIWTITLIGETLRIPNTVMGLTFVAAGVSVPDAVASLKVVKQGYADMAISNAIGSNIFDILICLGVPWFLRTAIIGSQKEVRVISRGMYYSTIMLLSTVFILITTIHKNGWKLDKKSGKILMIAYFVFISLAVFYELYGGKTED